ncbi:MAG: DUF2520 domain-containing protein [candidate division WOR-3 bacterium]|nr:MAG: DUF2520 domain-containing protein [candidate division WOR-3 bacterium]
MRIGLIGCGRVGTAIFCILGRDNKITGVYDIRKKNERTTAKLLKIRKNPDLHAIVNRSEAIFIATPDDEILRAFANINRHIRKRTYIFHFSGILTADIIPKSKKIYRASVHPFATFPAVMSKPKNKHFFLSVEGDPPAVKVLRKIFRSKHFTIRKIRKVDKAAYHLIGVFSSNLLIGLVASIDRLTAKIGWRRRDFEQMIFPLIEETLHNIRKYGVQDALTGPLARGDVGIIRKHLSTLQHERTLYNIYKALSRAVAENISDPKKNLKLKKVLH